MSTRAIFGDNAFFAFWRAQLVGEHFVMRKLYGKLGGDDATLLMIML